MDNSRAPVDRQPQRVFAGIGFSLFGYDDPTHRDEVSQKLVSGGAVEAVNRTDCTHVIVYNIAYDDPVCVAARKQGKIVVSGLWVHHSFAAGGLLLADSLMYVPPRDLKGIPGADSLVVCLTGYQPDDREDIRVMVGLMGAKFRKPLTSKVTHIICYKFEGEKYELAKRVKSIKLVNHKWLEDCLRKWAILPEEDYWKSGHEVEMEMEATGRKSPGFKDKNVPSDVAVPKTQSMAASTLASIPVRTPPSTIKTTSNQIKYQKAHKILDMIESFIKKENDEKKTTSAGVGTPLSNPAYRDEQNESSYGGRKLDVSSGSSKLQGVSRNYDILNRGSSHVESGQELKNNPPYDISDFNTNAAKSTPSKATGRNPSLFKVKYARNTAATSAAKDTPLIATGRKSPGFKDKNVPRDVAVPKTLQNKDFDVVQRPHTSLVPKNLVNDKTSRGKKQSLTKKGKKNEKVDAEISEFREEATLDRAGKANRNVNELDAVNDHGHKNGEPKDDRTNMDADLVSEKEFRITKTPLSKAKISNALLTVKEVTETKAVKKKEKTSSSRSVKARNMEGQKENMEVHEGGRSSGKKQVRKSATEGSVKVTRRSVTADSEPKRFVLTIPLLSQRRDFKQIIGRLKGRVCPVNHQWSYQATHFVVSGTCKRTEKFFAAAASGSWILKTDYLTASNQAGKFLAEEPYEWHMNGLSERGLINLEAPRKWRSLKEKTGFGAFHGMRIIIYGDRIMPPLDTLKRAVKAGDGTILATSPPYTRFLDTNIDFAVVHEDVPSNDMWVQEFLRYKIPCIKPSYLVAYICKPGYPLDEHVLYDTEVWARRSYEGLKNRLDEGEIIKQSKEAD